MTLQTIDSVRAYWDSRPCNSRHSTSPIMRQYSDEVTERKYFVEPHIPEFAEFEKWRGKRVLEVGCGIGTDTLQFAKAGAYVTALDLSEESLLIATKRAEIDSFTEHPARIHFVWANVENLPGYPNCCGWDMIYAFGSLHHTPLPEKAIAELRRIAKPGATFKLMVYNKYSWKALWILLKYGHGKFWKFRELIAKYSEAQTGCPVTHVYSPRELRAMLERNGFTVRKTYKDHIFPYEIEAYKQYRYERTWYWTLVPQPIFRWLERHFGWHLMAEATC